MKNAAMIGLTILALTIAGDLASSRAHARDADEKAVVEAANRFYVALNEMFTGDLTRMIDVWSHAQDVTYMGPAGDFRVGWAQVLSSWKEQAAMKLGGEVRPENMRVTVGRDLAVTHNFERGENVGAQGKREKVSIRATNLFRKEKGTWKMIGHHTDLLPHLQK